MIFFVIDAGALSKQNFSSITTSCPTREDPWAPHPVKLPIMIAWNEVPAYSTPRDFVNALLREASGDPVARMIMSALKKDYGFDLLAEDIDQNTINMVMDVFYDWSHPLVGNIASSPRLRPSTEEAQLTSWDYLRNLGFMSSTTIGAMAALIKHWNLEVGAFDRSPRDQVRIHYNITEAARAFIGEVSTEATKRLEKILALQLVRSGKLWAAQVKLLTDYVGKRLPALHKAVNDRGLGAMEYTRYYLPSINAAKEKRAVQLLNDLIKSASDGEIKLAPVLEMDNRAHLLTWEKLPLVIRCAILINDFRKLDGAVTQKMGPPKRTCLSYVGEKIPTTEERQTASYAPIQEPNSKCHVLSMVFEVRNRETDLRAWSWNRNEYAQTVITYRLNLCPLWGGSSGHTGGGLQHWMMALGDSAPTFTAQTVASSLFTLWRLYYDKRLSPVHTMTEVFEATFNEYVTGGRVTPSLRLNRTQEKHKFKDAFDLIGACSIPQRTGQSSIDPLMVFRTLRAAFWRGSAHEAHARLKTMIDQERKYLSLAHWLPQWSHELSARQGTDVREFDTPLTEREQSRLSSALAKK